MTKNQIMYQELQQTIRRDTVAAEVARGTLKENARHNVQMETETYRHNVQTENETYRHNLMVESISRDTLSETQRHNLAVEGETNRHNVVMEGQGAQGLAIEAYKAESGRIQAHASQTSAAAAYMNAQTNKGKLAQDFYFGMLDYNLRKQSNGIQMYNAETSRWNADINRYNADTNRQNANTNWYNAQINKANAETKRWEAEMSEKKLKLDILQHINNYVEQEVRIKKILADTELSKAQAGKMLADTIYAKDKNKREWIKSSGEILDRFTNLVRSILNGGKKQMTQ